MAIHQHHSGDALPQCPPPLQDPGPMPWTFSSSVQMGVGLSSMDLEFSASHLAHRKALQLAHCFKQQLPSLSSAVMPRSFHSLRHCCVAVFWSGYICSACICPCVASLHQSGICPGGSLLSNACHARIWGSHVVTGMSMPSSHRPLTCAGNIFSDLHANIRFTVYQPCEIEEPCPLAQRYPGCAHSSFGLLAVPATLRYHDPRE
jgi:hypothetical protein